ncbi:MAG: CPBP family intramembrane metalloprotease, partial [Pirellulales bacterium]|nr:CPBP family intramembrane metalloprotease [Pirellulales bacterium]
TARYAIAKLNELPFDRLSDRLDLPPLVSLLWLIVALVPMSAFFSALCLACAAFARSTKEGQYYLMPLFLVSMPLMMLPLSPGTEMTLGNSLIPITGVVMLVMNLVQGDYGVAMRYAVPVCVVTILCCHLAIRWAVYQFNQESVLFRESERLDPRRWLVHLVRDRQDTPSLAEACFCGVLILVIQFFVQLALPAELPANPTFRFLLMIVFISQVVCIALPALMMTLFLTQKPLVSLSLSRLPSLGTCGVAVLLAVSLHPFGSQLGEWINLLYPISPQVLANLDGLGKLFQCGSPPWLPYVLLAVVPAICEELAFRGFILSGLRHVGSKWWAIGLSAILFGISHGSLAIQQALSAAILGMVIGYLAVQSGSLVPCMLFHMTYNGLMFATQLWPSIIQTRPSLAVLVNDTSSGRLLYDWRITGLGAALASVLILWLHRLPYQATREEIIGRARAKQTQMPGSV